MDWKPGDRVEVNLPDKSRTGRRVSVYTWVGGTVRAIDPEGLPPGVKVDLDREVNGIRDCYATHSELRPASR